MSILIITANYKDSKPTENLINSIIKFKINGNLKIVIIDNESTEQSFSSLNMIRNKIDLDIEIIRSSINTYYWGGINLGLKQYYNKGKNFKWIIACNNDIEFNDLHFFKKLNKIKENSFSIIAPKITSSLSNKDLNPFMLKPISFIYDIYYSLYYFNFYTSKIVHKIGHIIKLIKNLLIINKSSIHQIYAPHGSCIIFNRSFFNDGGFLDTGFTMYGEEVSIAEIANKIKSFIFYVPSLSLIHNDHQSTSKLSLKSNFLHSKKTYYYLKKKYRS